MHLDADHGKVFLPSLAYVWEGVVRYAGLVYDPASGDWTLIHEQDESSPVFEQGDDAGSVTFGRGSAWLSPTRLLIGESAALLGAGRVHDLDLTDDRICEHDLDEDGEVGFGDLLRLLDAWSSGTPLRHDFDCDGVIGAGDLERLVGAWGPCVPFWDH